MARFYLSGFADEIASSLDEQIAGLLKNNIHYVELRSADGINVSDLTFEKAEEIYRRLSASNITVSALGSPIGKVDIREDFVPHLEKFRHTLKLCVPLHTKYVRIFSFFMPEGEDPAAYRQEVLERLTLMTMEAAARGVTLLHENEKAIYGDIPSRCADILSSINSSSLRATYDFSNFVQCDAQNYPEGYELLRPYIEYVHIKDSVYTSGSAQRDMGRQITGNAHRPAGMGDGQLKTILTHLYKEGYTGFLSIEPHLGEEYGSTGLERFTAAADAIKALIDDIIKEDTNA